LQRFAGTKLTCNAEMGPSEVRDFCTVEPGAEKLLKAAMQQLHLSARAFHRVLKLARTIADLAGSNGFWEGEMVCAMDMVSWVRGGQILDPGNAAPDLTSSINILLIGPLLSGWHEPASTLFDPEDHCPAEYA